MYYLVRYGDMTLETFKLSKFQAAEVRIIEGVESVVPVGNNKLPFALDRSKL